MASTRLVPTFLPVALAGVLLSGCPGTDMMVTPTPVLADGPDRFFHVYTQQSPLLPVTVEVGVWMHKERSFGRAAIADWLEHPYQGKELLEPINVLWLDPLVTDERGARDNVADFLGECGFRREGDQFFGLIPRHSSGYSAAYAGGVWRDQYDSDDAWVDGLLRGGGSNNHGRIFPAYEAPAGTSQSVFVTSGAFSREEGTEANPSCYTDVERCHAFVSFNRARDQLSCNAQGWRLLGIQDFGNVYPLSMGLSFSTADHSGTIVFEHVN